MNHPESKLQQACIAILLLLSACQKPELPTPEPQPTYKSAPSNLMRNGGGQCTTDWTGTANLATGWRCMAATISEVKSGDPRWDGNYQVVRSTSQFNLDSPPANTTGDWHTITFKYTSTVPVHIAAQYTDRCYNMFATVPAVDKPTYVQIKFWAPKVLMIRWYSPVNPKCQMCIDEVNLF